MATDRNGVDRAAMQSSIMVATADLLRRLDEQGRLGDWRADSATRGDTVSATIYAADHPAEPLLQAFRITIERL